jgi:anti-sigma factor RsiW
MNCRQCQQKLLHSLAAGDIPSAEVVAHESSCPACRKFHAAENSLFRSIDSGLRSLANQPVPHSLLPSLSICLDEKFMANQAPFYRWGFTAVATATNIAGFAQLRKSSIRLAAASRTTEERSFCGRVQAHGSRSGVNQTAGGDGSRRRARSLRQICRRSPG